MKSLALILFVSVSDSGLHYRIVSYPKIDLWISMIQNSIYGYPIFIILLKYPNSMCGYPKTDESTYEYMKNPVNTIHP